MEYNRTMNNKKFFVFLPLVSLLLSGCMLMPKPKDKTSTSNPSTSSPISPDTGDNSDITPDPSVDPVPVDPPDLPEDVEAYYSGISDDLMGTDLLIALQNLNKEKRTSLVGYDDMGTSSSDMFKYTDYDPSTVRYDENNQPYGTRIVSFYSGNTMTSFNREHVWPKSHGGHTVDDDIHMPRPTIPAENGSRGNSFYVEGMKDSKNGWDPAEEDFGEESYRGDSARIIFYCVVANPKLDLVELEYHETSNANPDYLMGKLSDMIKWNNKYAVQDRELRRNSGAQYLQGNRNPFIDHPEYACRIWGSKNSTTKAICGMQ